MKCLIAAVGLALLLASCSTTRDVVGTTITDTTITVTPPPIAKELLGSPDSSVSDGPAWVGQDSSGRVQFILDMQDALSRMSSNLRAEYDSTMRQALARARGMFRVNLQPPQVEIRYRDTTIYREREVPRGPTIIEKLGWGALGAIVLLVMGGAVYMAKKLLWR